MADPIVVDSRVVIPVDAMEVRATRSGGPGGQNVNKVATRIQLYVDLDRIEGLTEDQLARLEELAHRKLDAEGRLLVSSSRTRVQSRNLAEARDKVRRMVVRALKPPKRRRATRPTKASRERRLEQKRRRSETKRQRQLSTD